MKNSEFKSHWENIYENKNENEVSWFQKNPETSTDLIKSSNIDKTSKIIDVGAGVSRLVDNLLELGFYNIDVVDISRNAINKTKTRLGKKSELVNWIESDIINFKTNKKYQLWHDRAVFHFLNEKSQIESYRNLAENLLESGSTLIIGTFSVNGPNKCSGLSVKQYDENSIRNVFKNKFEVVSHETVIHDTPFKTKQEFIFSTFKKK
tara:strand:+ start:4696 stop:5316 length:621 start_codon:yes stop_codon:yes gene_type:complete